MSRQEKEQNGTLTHTLNDSNLDREIPDGIPTGWEEEEVSEQDEHSSQDLSEDAK